MSKKNIALITAVFLLNGMCIFAQSNNRISLNNGWRFMRYTSTPDKLIYDIRPEIKDRNDNVVADTKPTEAVAVTAFDSGLKKWILPAANNFIKDSSKHYIRPAGNPGADFPFVKNNFNDAAWQQVTLPHDWAINGPFYTGENAIVGGGMGRLPVQGVAWYRRKINITPADAGKNIYLDIDGAMSYAMVWCNGNLVGGWPYGYNSFRLDLTPYVKPGNNNQLAIRIDNPTNSARWYPGAGIYRNVWLTKTDAVHVAHWGTFVTTKNVSAQKATVLVNVQIENNYTTNKKIQAVTEIFTWNARNNKVIKKVASLPAAIQVAAGNTGSVSATAALNNPLLWGPPPMQQPNLYAAITKLYVNNKLVDAYKTVFGIRAVEFDAVNGIKVNGEKIRLQGVNQHHDLGALGAAFNIRAAERQLEILAEMGCNAIRLAHNPPAPELLDLTDRMGFLVID